MRKKNIIFLIIPILLFILGAIVYKNQYLSENMDPKTWDETTANIVPITWQQKNWISVKSQKERIIHVPYISGTVQDNEVFGDDSRGECSYTIFFNFDEKMKKDVLYTIEHRVKERLLSDHWMVKHDGEGFKTDGSGKFYYLEVIRNNEGGEEKTRITVSNHNDENYVFFGYYLPPCSTAPLL